MNDIQKPDQNQDVSIEVQQMELKKLAVEGLERVTILVVVLIFVHTNLETLLEHVEISIGIWLAMMGLRWNNQR